MSSENEQQPDRTSGRHAAPRLTVRGRMRRPVGRALALTAMPTALLMTTLAPKLAFAADAKAKATNAAPDVAPSGTACTQGKPGTGTGAGATTTGTGTAAGKTGAAPAGSATATPQASRHSAAALPKQRSGTGSTAGGSTAGGGGTTGGTGTGASQPGTGSGSGSGTPAGTPSTAPSPAPSAPSSPTDPITGILTGLGGLLGIGGHSSAAVAATPAAAPSSAPAVAPKPRAAAEAAPTQSAAPTPSSTPTAPATPSAGKPAAPSHPAAKPTAKPQGATPSPSASVNTDPNKPCDVRHMAAPLDTSITSTLPGGTMPIEPWTLKSSDLLLMNTEFHGVVTVPLADGTTERVLKFTAESVNIGNLDMSSNQRGQQLHVQGGPGTTSTMRNNTVTMYVKELKGTLLSAEGIPLSLLNVNIDLTPDTLPQWLYNLVGAIPIPLTLELGNMTAIQAGQFGGDLTIPGMHLYYTPLGQ